MPSSNVEFWFVKLEANKLRDRSVVKELGESGWRSLVIWECEVREETEVEARLREFPISA
jgi:DNA mismatch endonuclease (patch repair protein)